MCIKSVVWAEARGESYVGQQAVAHVLINRATKSKRSICFISNQNGQFKRRTPPRDFRIDVTDYDPTGGGLYFKNYPGRWGRKKFLTKIGKQYFYG